LFSLKNILKELNPPTTGQQSYIVQFLGLTKNYEQIPVIENVKWSTPTDKIKILIIFGTDEKPSQSKFILPILQATLKAIDSLPIQISLIPFANISGESLKFPPDNNFFYSDTHPSSQYIWRWISMRDPDLIIEFKNNQLNQIKFESNLELKLNSFKFKHLQVKNPVPGSLVNELPKDKLFFLKQIPTIEINGEVEKINPEINYFLPQLTKKDFKKISNQNALVHKLKRSPIEISKTLSLHYGKDLYPCIYTNGVAVSGQIRLASLENLNENTLNTIINQAPSFTEKYLSTKFTSQISAPEIAGVLWADELSEYTGDHRYQDLILKAANMFHKRTENLPPFPLTKTFIVEDFFFSATILGRAFKISKNLEYIEILVSFLLNANLQQKSGLFWHSRNAHFYWGRGNGFAAIGLAEALTFIPKNHSSYPQLINMFQKLMKGMLKAQDFEGMWHQVSNVQGSYSETTSTCMMGFALSRGLLMKWISGSVFENALSKAWEATNKRIGYNGSIIDACTGTGVQTNTIDYFKRPAITGFDDRAGSMAIWFSTEFQKYCIWKESQVNLND